MTAADGHDLPRPIDVIAAAICAADEAGEDAHGTDAVSALALDALDEAGYVVLPRAEVKHALALLWVGTDIHVNNLRRALDG